MLTSLPEIIPLSPDLLENYRQIAIATFRQTFDRHNTGENMESYLDKAFDLPLLERELDPVISRVFLARLEGQTVGYLKMNFPPAFTHPVEDSSVEVERIYVDTAHQGKKIGEALLQTAVKEALMKTGQYLWLGVWEKNSNALAFYAKKGFVVFGSHPFLLGDDKQTDLLMRLDLHR